MKTYQEYLVEKVEGVFGQEETKNLIFTPVPHLPLTPKTVERLRKLIPEKTMWHATGFENVKKLIKIQGTKKSVAGFTFTKRQGIFVGGAVSGGGFIVELKGTPLFHAADDFYSRADSQGRRWITLDVGVLRRLKLEKKFEKLKEKFYRKHAKKVNKILEDDIDAIEQNDGDFDPGFMLRSLDSDEGDGWEGAIVQWQHLRDKKLKNRLMKEFFDLSEKFLIKYKETIFNFNFNFERDTTVHDEVILTNFKIMRIFLVNDDPNNVKTLFDEGKEAFKGYRFSYIQPAALNDYIKGEL